MTRLHIKPVPETYCVLLIVACFAILSNSCKSRAALTVTTASVSGIMQTGAVSGGEVITRKHNTVVAKGVCWALNPDPVLSDSKTNEGPGKGVFTSSVTGLQPGTDYYLRAYATTGSDTVYGTNVSFATENYSTVTDIEGNIYNVITIGKQTWMAENLKTSTYNDGSSIHKVKDEAAWAGSSTPACCWYGNDEEAFRQIYGTLYNWYSVNTGKLCPSGWHVPSDAEWSVLVAFLNGEKIAGGKLKEAGTTYWVEPNYGATNEYGFTALPGGFRYYDGKFFDFGFSGYWWSSSELTASRAFFRFLYYNESIIYRFDNDKKNGFSIRCLKD